MMTKTRLLPLLLIVFVVSAACNLARPEPTPTPQPTPFIQPTPLPGQPSLTPLGQGNQRVIEGENGVVCIVPPDWVEYTVEPGDSLGLLSEQTGRTVEEIARVNCLSDANNLFAGQLLYLPRIPVIGS